MMSCQWRRNTLKCAGECGQWNSTAHGCTFDLPRGFPPLLLCTSLNDATPNPTSSKQLLRIWGLSISELGKRVKLRFLDYSAFAACCGVERIEA
jgi:hypothetical protein